MKSVARVLCLSLVIAGLPRPCWASGEKATAAEDAKYAELEADSPDAAAFEGGFDWGVFAVIVIIVLVAYMVADVENALRSPLEGEGESPPPLFR